MTMKPAARNRRFARLRTTARIHDRALHSYFVMNPASPGWRKQVVRNCRPAPDLCFLDAMGDDGYDRMSARPTVSLSWWRAQTTALANYVEHASTRYHVIANNLITVTHPRFLVAYDIDFAVLTLGATQATASFVRNRDPMMPRWRSSTSLTTPRSSTKRMPKINRTLMLARTKSSTWLLSASVESSLARCTA